MVFASLPEDSNILCAARPVGAARTHEYFNILPQLKSGVIIHIHDIFYPFVYPEKWLKEGRAYTEAYVLRALLENNDDYEIIFWN